MKHFSLIIVFISALFVNPSAHAQGEKFDGNKNSAATAEQLKEADKVFQNCKATLKLHRYYDCECYASRFLDGRIKAGPKAQQEVILQTFYNDCRNIPDSTKYEYARCISDTKVRPVRNIASEDFCQCYSDQWAQRFESHQGLVNMDSKNLIRRHARAYCKRPANYAQ
ncbi:hypothetical protein MNBD_GAMMA15-915 [hydrothermal vent metagenome]|uniref:Uncharacterized protein n=1 Tax=hydrothermal vent metagenome TaxID=652676 RepID=A0A3B0Z2Z1_9ZZZZ